MFVGHYGVSYGSKPIEPRVPVWILFLAVQFLDVLWGALVLLGVEHVRIVPGITETNPLDLYYMPYSHSLPAAVLWSLVAVVGYRAWRGSDSGSTGPLIVGAAVFSHWVLDLLVHRPDLPLFGNRFKVGLGLWNMPLVAFGLEALMLVGGLWLYMRSTGPVTRVGALGPPVFVLAMLAIQAVTFFGTPPSSPTGAATTALVAYFVLAAIAGWLDGKRRYATAAA